MKFRKKPIIVEATQWFKNGDHPEDDCRLITPVPGDGEPFLSEGKVVRRFRHPGISGENLCDKCGCRIDDHGFLEQPNYNGMVCPGNWILTELDGKGFYPCTNRAFEEIYEPVE